VPSESLGILLISGGHERAHYAFLLAAGAAALGRRVVLFATNEGCRALLADAAALAEGAADAAVRTAGVAGLAELREAAVEFGVRMIACQAGMQVAGIDRTALLPGVQVAGVATFLEEIGAGQIITL